MSPRERDLVRLEHLLSRVQVERKVPQKKAQVTGIRKQEPMNSVALYPEVLVNLVNLISGSREKTEREEEDTEILLTWHQPRVPNSWALGQRTLVLLTWF